MRKAKKNEKVVLKKDYFEKVRKNMKENDFIMLEVGDNGLVLHLFNGEVNGKDSDYLSVFYIDDGAWYRNKLCTLHDLDYIEIDDKNKTTTISNGYLKIVIFEDAKFEEYFVKDVELIDGKYCAVCGEQVTMFDEEKAGETLCQECFEHYDYNEETDEFELIK